MKLFDGSGFPNLDPQAAAAALRAAVSSEEGVVPGVAEELWVNIRDHYKRRKVPHTLKVHLGETGSGKTADVLRHFAEVIKDLPAGTRESITMFAPTSKLSRQIKNRMENEYGVKSDDYRRVDVWYGREQVDGDGQAHCVGEVLQADRSRAQHRTKEHPVDVYIWNTLDLGDAVVFDDVVTPSDMLTWHARMAAHGIVPVAPQRNGVNELAAMVLHDTPFKSKFKVKHHRKHRQKDHGETLETLKGQHGFDDEYLVSLKVPGISSKVACVLDASTMKEAEALVRRLIDQERLPEGTTPTCMKPNSKAARKYL